MGLFSRKPRFVDAIVVEYRLIVGADIQKFSEGEDVEPGVVAKPRFENVIGLCFPDHEFVLYIDSSCSELEIIEAPGGDKREIHKVLVPYEVYEAIVGFVSAKAEFKAQRKAVQKLLNMR